MVFSYGGRGRGGRASSGRAQKGLCPGATMEGILQDMDADRGQGFLSPESGGGQLGQEGEGVQGGLLAPQNNSDGNKDLGPQSQERPAMGAPRSRTPLRAAPSAAAVGLPGPGPEPARSQGQSRFHLDGGPASAARRDGAVEGGVSPNFILEKGEAEHPKALK